MSLPSSVSAAVMGFGLCFHERERGSRGEREREIEREFRRKKGGHLLTPCSPPSVLGFGWVLDLGFWFGERENVDEGGRVQERERVVAVGVASSPSKQSGSGYWVDSVFWGFWFDDFGILV